MRPAYVSDRALRRATAWLLAFTVLFMVYASLYPFDFNVSRLAHFGPREWARTLAWRKPVRSDLIANLIFYLPFGALVTSIAPRRWGLLRRFLFALGCGTGLSLLIELAQGMTANRDPSLVDVIVNATSAGLASLLALGARGLGLKPMLPELRTSRPDVIAVLIVGLWIAMHAAPFMPAQRFVWYFTNPARARLALVERRVRGIPWRATCSWARCSEACCDPPASGSCSRRARWCRCWRASCFATSVSRSRNALGSCSHCQSSGT